MLPTKRSRRDARKLPPPPSCVSRATKQRNCITLRNAKLPRTYRQKIASFLRTKTKPKKQVTNSRRIVSNLRPTKLQFVVCSNGSLPSNHDKLKFVGLQEAPCSK